MTMAGSHPFRDSASERVVEQLVCVSNTTKAVNDDAR